MGLRDEEIIGEVVHLTSQEKIEMLINEFGYDEETARRIINA